MSKRFWGLVLLFVVVLCSGSHAVEPVIQGNHIYWENDLARLSVAPHTASNPSGNQTQNFTLTYKGETNVTGIRAVYYFDYKPTGSVYLQQNGEWVNITGNWHTMGQQTIDGETYWYYYSDQFGMDVNQTRAWKLNYTTTEKSGKWTLAFIKGDYDCLITDDCTKQWVLDPWWNSDYNKQYAVRNLVVPANGKIFANTNFAITDLNVSDFVVACGPTDGENPGNLDMNDFRVYDTNNALDLDRNITWNGAKTDFNVTIKTQNDIEPGTYNGLFYIYTNNSACPTPNTTIASGAAGTSDTFEDGDRTNDPTWTAGTVDTDSEKEGSYGMNVTGAANPTTDVVNESLGSVFGGWIKATDAGAADALYFRYADVGTSAVFGIFIQADAFRTTANEAGTNFTTTPQDNTWYYVKIEHVKNSADLTFTIYDTDMLELETDTRTTADLDDLAKVNIYVNVTTSYFDNIIYGPGTDVLDQNYFSILLGEQETISDLLAPTIETFFIDANYGFFGTDSNVIVTLRCNDDVSSELWYSIKLNDQNKFWQQVDTNSTQDINFSPSGLNNITVECYDINSHVTTDTNAYRALYVNVPKNEQSLVSITPYSIIISGVEGDSNAPIHTISKYGFTSQTGIAYVDINATGYYSRRYSFNLALLNEDLNLQPYLVSTVTGIQTTIKVLGASSGTGIPGLTLVTQKNVGGVDANVESGVTDSGGAVSFSFNDGDSYTILVFAGTTLLATETFNAITSAFTIYISFDIPIVIPVGMGYLDVNWLPVYNYVIVGDNNLLDINLSIRAHVQEITCIDLNFWNGDQNIYSDHNTSITTSGVLLPDINLMATGFSYGSPVTIELKVLFADGNILYYKAFYTVVHSSTCDWENFSSASYYVCWMQWRQDVLVDEPNELNPTGSTTKPVTTFLAFIIALALSISMCAVAKLNYSAAGFVFLTILGLLTFMNWVNWDTFGLAAFATIGGFMVWYVFWR